MRGSEREMVGQRAPLVNYRQVGAVMGLGESLPGAYRYALKEVMRLG